MQALFIGINTVDLQFLAPCYPAENTKIRAEKINVFTGGPATNAAVIYSQLGGEATLVSPIGVHEFTNFIQADLSQNNIRFIDPIKDILSEPALASVLTNTSTGSRTIFSYSSDKTVREIKYNRPSVDYNILLWDSFFPTLAEDSLKEARKRSIPVVLDGGSWKPWLEEYLNYIDIAICSNDFVPPETGADKTRIIEYLLQKKIKTVIITRGAEPVIYANSERIKEIPVPEVNVVDTIGAGDFFHGAFCYYYAMGLNISRCIQRASVIASKSCKYVGTREWLKQLKNE